ncbi:succinyldiaminopimelate aminotransferase [Sanguibacter keddieii DSM 10542]|uniref:Succinyldiaminopimelate aminotransferase n=1 Tax=Sanguibacter keddieii (strain ATCC 51767 / DSM 10542 / NCFB 3025 / ST-74) TaxID=446469 RepID=D1BF14_SANKS|nr:aminotransferase class I/II-fold pyridoxal phosphate-dependent enzyme [Sanguibacter keddieii]ACZ21310.1 succinyldiaminopimelate aminotransferase [Sanguibacter keddieii DSM 10542]
MTTPRPAGAWHRTARAAGLLGSDGTVAPTIFAEMSALAATTGAINLGQGFPEEDGPEFVREAAVAAIREGHNQYPPGPGTPELLRAVAQHQERCYGLSVDPASEVLVTAGATEAITATLLALCEPGDEVVTLEPFYDSHAAAIALAGAVHRTVPLRRTAGSARFALDVDALRTTVGPQTRIILVNTPHNPTGTVLTRAELGEIAAVAQQHDVIVVTDEVYEHLTFDDVEHVPVATLSGMADRTVTISSAGKTFSLTGWKIGWLHARADLVTAIRTVKQYLTYVNGAPFQPAVALALTDPRGDEAVRALRDSLAHRRDLLCEGLVAAGFDVVVPQGTYFVVADGAPLGYEDGAELARRLPDLAGVVGVPVSAFCQAGSETAALLRSSIRFTFVKTEASIEHATQQLAAAGRPTR